MSNPALAYTQPDVETHLVMVLSALPGVKVWVEDVEYKYPFWSCNYTVVMTARAGSKQAASDVAQDAHDLLIASRNDQWDDGVLLGVIALAAPAWAPDQNGAPKYAGRYQVVARPKGNTP